MEELGNKILDKIKDKNYIKRYLILAFSLFVSSINYNLLILPSGIVTGGTTGVATIAKQIFDLDPSLVIFLLSFLILIISLIYLGKEDTLAALFIAIVHPFFIKVTEQIFLLINITNSSLLLISIFSGIISGFTNGLIYKTGLNTGGFGVLSKLFGQKKKASISKINFIINFLIVLFGAFIFGVNMVMYACVILYITKYVSERVLLGVSKNKMFCIISNKHEKIKDFIMNDLKHDVTIFNVKGKFEDKKLKNIMAIIPTSEYVLVKEKIKEIDKNVFLTITDNYEVVGQDIKITSVKGKKSRLISRIFSDKVV